MVLDFDTREFLQNLKATKPPYECPIDRCGKIYKSFSGIEHHLHQAHGVSEPQTPVAVTRKGRQNVNNNRSKREKSPSPASVMRTPAREALTYAEAQRMIEVDIDGSIHRININEPLNIIYIDGKNGFNVDAVIDSKSNLNDSKSKADVITGKGKNKDKSKTGKASKRNNGSTVVTGVEIMQPEPPKLPEPSFRVIENYKSTAPEIPPRPSSYFRYIDKSQEELDEEVEYDMDEEDCAWLDLINSKRKHDGLTEVPADTFELLMDRLEKESYFLSQNSGKDVGPAIDEDAVCCICNDGECQNTNAILFCDMCNLAVHQECYGVPYIPEGQWLCRRCLQSPSRAVDCVLCPNKGGAFKQTDDNRWTHVVCALWIPEVCFANTVFLEPIDSIDNIPAARWKLTCYICKQRNIGACIQCHKTNCYTAFHVTCAQQAGLYMKMEAVEIETPAGSVHRSVRKTAYCHQHAPSDENGSALSGVYNSGDDEDSRSSLNNKRHQLGIEAAFKEKMKKARKILAEKRSALPIVSIPTIPPDRLMKTAAMINIPKRNQFIQRLLGYWTLKRQSRNGVPLLRRLQISYTGAKRGEESRDDDEQAKKMKEELKCMQRLRQDLERARLLVELIRKREKLKKEYIKVMQATVETQLRPFNVFLKRLLHQLELKDTHKFFAEPVNIREVPDYLEFVKHPMDFSTMRSKISSNQYTAFSQFEADFHKIIENCMFYNDKETIYYKAANRLREAGRHIIKEAKQAIIRVGYNEAAGIHLPEGAAEEPKDSLTRVRNEALRLEEQLKELNEDLSRAQQAKSGGSKTKKLQLLTSQIASVKRQMALLNPTGFNLPAIDSTKNSEHDNKSEESAKLIENILQNNRSPRNGLLLSGADSFASDRITSPLKSEGRRTMNSVSSVCFNELLTNTPRKDSRNANESPNKKSKSRSRIPLKNKSSDIIAASETNGEINTERVNDDSSKSDAVNSSVFSSISPLASHNNNSKSYANLENGSQSRCSSFNKSPIHRTLTADASTCTPSNMFAVSAPTLTKERANRVKKRTNKSHGSSRSKRIASDANSLQSLTSNAAPPFPNTSLPQTDSFKVYRSNMNSSSDSDAKSESSHSSGSSSSSSGSSASSRSYSSRSYSGSESSFDQVEGGNRKSSTRKSPRRPTSRSSRSDISVESQNRIPLEPLDLVWAKCRGYPWYPALIVNPEMPKTGYFHNGVPIPVPPDDVLALKKNHTEPVYLVLFFDAKRTWQWLPRNKLEPLGVNTGLDKAKLTESRKQADKKAVKKAFEKAIIHRCRVTGESTDFSGDSSNED